VNGTVHLDRASFRAETEQKVTTMASQKTNENEIDYMHPHGKPEMKPEAIDEAFEPIEQKIKDARASQKSIEEADGHHVCSKKCQKHHSVKAKGAHKTP
jgi:hypothetical protein